MGWAVGFDRDLGRFRGYGVPSYCDAKGCRVEIDRGLAWIAVPPPDDPDEGLEDEDFDELASGAYFVCGEHRYSDVDPTDLPPEHPEWVTHVSTDESWARWREDNGPLLAAWANTT